MFIAPYFSLPLIFSTTSPPPSILYPQRPLFVILERTKCVIESKRDNLRFFWVTLVRRDSIATLQNDKVGCARLAKAYRYARI